MKYRALIQALLVTSLVYILIDNKSNQQDGLPTQDRTERVTIKKKALAFISELASYASNDDLDSYVNTLRKISSYLGGLSQDNQFYFRDVLEGVPQDKYEVIIEFVDENAEIIDELMEGDLTSDILILAME